MVRVLVVEDEANIREMIALNLRLAGMEGRPCSLRWGMIRWSCTGGRDFTGYRRLILSVSAGALPPLPKGEALAVIAKFAVSSEAPTLGATTTTAASGGLREELLGQRPARMRTE